MSNEKTKKMEEIVKRLKIALDTTYKQDVAKALGCNLSHLSRAIKTGTIPYKYIDNLCDTEHLSRRWVLTGEGSMRGGDTIMSDRDEYLKTIQQMSETIAKLATNAAEIAECKAELKRLSEIIVRLGEARESGRSHPKSVKSSNGR